MATDADAPSTDNSDIKFEFVNSKCTPDKLMIDQITGEILVTESLDSDTDPMITCGVLAWSSNNKAGGSTATVTVTVKDVNDNRPIFSPPMGFYQANVSEYFTSGDAVLTVTATDKDAGLDGEIVYSMQPNDTFTIDPETGDVTVSNATLNYEFAISYLLAIIATDKGTPALSSSILFQVTIEPKNEFKPIFVGNATATIPENALPGTFVFQASAEDEDAGIDGLLRYALLTTGVPFDVNSDTGIVRVAGKLDYETKRMYNLEIIAYDSSTSGVQYTTTQTFTVTVTDVNDLAVLCAQQPAVTVSYPFSIGGVVAKLDCTDPDAIPTTLFFNVTSGNDEGSFEINNSTGEIILLQVPMNTLYEFEIDVSDGVDNTQTWQVILAEQMLEFTNLPRNITVNEESGGSVLLDVDACCAFPQVRYSILSGNGDKSVSMTESSGVVTQTLPYDREVKDFYEYEIQAVSDSGQKVTDWLRVWVDDINDNTPAFGAGVYYLPIDESHPPGPIASYIATDADTGVNADLTYKIASGDPGSVFNIDPNTGQLSLVGSLDYETLTSYTLVLEAEDGGVPPLTGTTTVQVQVVNTDDNPAMLVTLPGGFTRDLKENAALGSSVFLLQASDADNNTVFTYAIADGNTDNDFGIDPGSGYIFIDKLLDRERTASYSLNLSATDQNGKSVFGTLDITILDVNDNNPIFTPDVYSLTIPDNFNSGQSVGTLVVSDADEGVNADFDLTIVSGNTGNAFVLNGMDVENNIMMEYVKVSHYALMVEAVDKGTPARTGSALVLITVSPPTNANPSFAVDTATVTVNEDVNVGYLIYDVNATALGATEDGYLIYTIMSGNTGNVFAINQDLGQVYVAMPVDYDTTSPPPPPYTLVIQASSSPTTTTDDFTLTVNVVNINDNTPEFPQGGFSFDVLENATFNSVVGNVTATDGDRGTFGTVTHDLTGSADFRMDPSTGNIIVKNVLDYTRKSVYNLIATATDGGTPPKSAIASIVIRIVDVNDHAPVFTSGTAANVTDSAPVGSEIFRFYATDEDTGEDGRVSYFIADDPSPGTFTLDPDTGILETTALLDAAVTPSYNIIVTASDNGNPSLATNTTLTITVISTNPNYNDPVLATTPATYTVNRQAAKGYLVFTASATDADSGPSGELTYRIKSGNDDGYFVMNPTTGAVMTSTDMLQAPNSFALEVVVTDKGTPPRNDTATFTITVSPQRTTSITSDYSFTVPEDTAVTSQVGVILVDGGRTVSAYYITSGDPLGSFTITPDVNGNGVINVAQALDAETYSVYTLLVTAETDIGNFTKVVQIDVEDINDNPPDFGSTTLTLEVVEYTPVGTLTYTVSYTDDDLTAANRDNTLSVEAPGTSLFDIDQAGRLTRNAVPDANSPIVTFNIIAVENTAPSGTSTLTVTVNIIDVPEEEEQSSSTVTDDALISRETAYQSQNGDVVYTLKPGDFGFVPSPSASVSYTFFDTTIPFTIDPNTGVMSVDGTLRDATTYYLFATATVVDAGVTATKAALIRVDTYDRNAKTIIMESPQSLTTVEANLDSLLARTQAFFPDTQRVGFGKLMETSAGTAIEVYAVGDTAVDEMDNVNEAKSFLTDQELLQVLQLNADGTPVPGVSDTSGAGLKVDTVEPYQETQQSTNQLDSFATSTAGIVTFVLLGALVVAVVVLAVLCYLHRTSAKPGVNPSNERNVARERRPDNTNRGNFTSVPEETPSTHNGGIYPVVIPASTAAAAAAASGSVVTGQPPPPPQHTPYTSNGQPPSNAPNTNPQTTQNNFQQKPKNQTNPKSERSNQPKNSNNTDHRAPSSKETTQQPQRPRPPQESLEGNDDLYFVLQRS